MATDHVPRRAEVSLRRRILQAAVSLALVVAIFVGVLPRIASYEEVWATISDMTWLEVVTLLLVSAWNIITYWFLLVAVMPGLRVRQAAVVNQASTAVANTVPGGGAIAVGVSYAMYHSWGFSGERFALSTIVSGVWNNFVKLGMPVIALGLLVLEGNVNPALITAALVGLAALAVAIAVLGLVLSSSRLARRVGEIGAKLINPLRRLLRRPSSTDLGEATVGFRNRTVGLLRTRWLGITAASLVSHLSLYLVLLVTLRHVGVSNETVSWILVLATFAFVRLISALPVTPGGLGVVELGYTAGLAAGLDEPMRAKVVAAVLVFRALTYFLPIPLGATAYLFWRRNRSWRAESPAEELESSTAQM